VDLVSWYVYKAYAIVPLPQALSKINVCISLTHTTGYNDIILFTTDMNITPAAS
jgi:hypothetical protein